MGGFQSINAFLVQFRQFKISRFERSMGVDEEAASSLYAPRNLSEMGFIGIESSGVKSVSLIFGERVKFPKSRLNQPIDAAGVKRTIRLRLGPR